MYILDLHPLFSKHIGPLHNGPIIRLMPVNASLCQMSWLVTKHIVLDSVGG